MPERRGKLPEVAGLRVSSRRLGKFGRASFFLCCFHGEALPIHTIFDDRPSRSAVRNKTMISQSAGLLFKLDADSSGVKRELAAVDASIGSLGGKMSTFGGMATVAAAGVAAIGAAALTAGRFLFDLTKATSEYGSEIFDATQKTGLAAETISSLKVAADQSGSSLDAVTGGIAKFAKTIGEAADGSETAQAKLAKIGVTASDMETALGQALQTIAKYPPGVQQMTAAQAAFGKSGADLLPFIKSFDGDLPGLIAKMKELGVTMSDKNARAADEFGDTLDTLTTQAAGVGRQFAFEMMPAITRSMQAVSGWLVANQGTISAWGRGTVEVLSGVVNAYRGLAYVAGEAFNHLAGYFHLNIRATSVWSENMLKLMTPVITGFRNLAGIADGIPDQIKAGTQTAADKVKFAIPPIKMPTFSNAGGKSKASRADDSEAREAEARERRDLAAQISLERKNLETIRQQLSETFDGIRATFAEDGDTDAFFADSREAMERFTEALQSSLSLLDALENRSRASMTENERALLTAEQLERRQDAVNLGKAEYAENRESLAKKEKEWDEERNAEAEYNIKLGQQQVGLIIEKMQAEQEAADQMIANLAAIDPALQMQPGSTEVSPYGPFQSWIDGWTQFVAQVNADAPTLGQSLQALGGIFVNAFAGMAQAMGGVVQQWVLMGSTGPAVMRKILASALASIAAEAAVRAIWELALGFATLFTNPSESAGHFVAAALFGSVAVGAGLAGRAVAGDAFKQQAQTSTSSSSAGSTANSGQGSAGKAGVYSSQEDMIVERGRNTLAGRLGTVLVKIQTTKDHVLDVVTEGLRHNSPIRVEIQNAVT